MEEFPESDDEEFYEDEPRSIDEIVDAVCGGLIKYSLIGICL